MTDGLLLLHAFPVDASMWEPQLSSLGTDVRVVAPDFPGFGGSTVPLPVLHMDAAADTAADAAAGAGLSRVVVCGRSMGGYAMRTTYWQIVIRSAGGALTGCDRQTNSPKRSGA